MRSFKVCLDAKERVGFGKQREATAPFIPDKTLALVPEFAVEDLLSGRTATMIPKFAVEVLPLGRTATFLPEFAVEDLPSAELQPWFLHLQ